MRPSHRGLHVLAATAVIACCSAVSADEPVTTADFEGEPSRPSLIQRIAHLFQPAPEPVHGVVQYGMTSPYYALWQSPDLYADDMRCRPTPWAPRGYGYAKKTSCVRMDYAPYAVQATESYHGPALWPRIFRTPCCDCGHSTHCEVCGSGASYAPQQ
jgi:hypothetical protein